jgi:hypothetical protein
MFYINTKQQAFCRNCFRLGMKGMHGRICCEDPTNITDKICFSKAIYDFPGGKGLRCAVHKKDNMINVNNGLCQYHHSCGKRCRDKAEFGNFKKERCTKHKTINMKKISSRYYKKKTTNN